MRTKFRKTTICNPPQDWDIVKIEEVAHINRESREPEREAPESHFLYIDIESVENESGVIKEPRSILGRDAPSRARRIIREDDVIMSTVRPYLKAFALVPVEYDNQICSTGFAVLTSKGGIVPKYLLYSLFSDNVINQCNAMMVGGQYPALNNSHVARIRIPLPSPSEQEFIAIDFS